MRGFFWVFLWISLQPRITKSSAGAGMYCLDRNEEGRKRKETCSLGSEPPLDWGALHLRVVYVPERRRLPTSADPGSLLL